MKKLALFIFSTGFVLYAGDTLLKYVKKVTVKSENYDLFVCLGGIWKQYASMYKKIVDVRVLPSVDSKWFELGQSLDRLQVQLKRTGFLHFSYDEDYVKCWEFLELAKTHLGQIGELYRKNEKKGMKKIADEIATILTTVTEIAQKKRDEQPN